MQRASSKSVQPLSSVTWIHAAAGCYWPWRQGCSGLPCSGREWPDQCPTLVSHADLSPQASLDGSQCKTWWLLIPYTWRCILYKTQKHLDTHTHALFGLWTLLRMYILIGVPLVDTFFFTCEKSVNKYKILLLSPSWIGWVKSLWEAQHGIFLEKSCTYYLAGGSGIRQILAAAWMG